MPARTSSRFVDELQAEIAKRSTQSDGRVDIVRKKLRTVVSRCGWKARSKERIARLQTALEATGIYPFPDLDDSDLGLDDYVRFSRRRLSDRPLGLIFGKEEGLQRYFFRYHVDVFDGVEDLTDLELIGREEPVTIGTETKKIDLLFCDSDGTNVVVEFKRGDPERGAPNQLREYMDAIRTKGLTVRGVLITARPRTEHLERLIRGDIDSRRDKYPIDWYWYSLNVQLERA